jgi:hypothetical protein
MDTNTKPWRNQNKNRQLPLFAEFLRVFAICTPYRCKSGKKWSSTYETPLQKLSLKTRVFADALLPLFAEFLHI